MRKPREATTRLWDMVRDGVISSETVMRACLNYMSESDVADMCHSEGFFEDDEENTETEEGEDDDTEA